MRDLVHRTVASVLLPLVLFHLLPSVTSQQELESRDFNRHTSSAVSVIGITVLAMIIVLSMVACCLYNTFYSGGIEVAAHQVLNSITRRGLEKDVIEAFPCFLYSEVKEHKIGKGGVECAICLSEFEDEETLRWMPPCSHTFHANCVDVWLSSRSTCPVCRANLSLKPGESFPNPVMDVETGNSHSSVHESPEISGNSVTSNNNENSKTPRSRSTGLLSSWRMAEIFFPRSHSTGHSLVQLGENVDRYTLQLPEEVQRQLVNLNLIRRSQMALPRARSSRQGYRSGSVGTKRSGFPKGRQTLRRAISMSPPFSFQAAPVALGKDNLIGETSQANDYFGERSFERLMPEKA